MKTSSDRTHRPTAVDPARFRNQATGIGQSCQASEMTGAMRKVRVEAAMPPKQRAAVPTNEGYGPVPAADMVGMHEC